MTAVARTRVAIYLPSLAGGGAERAMLNLAQGLAERDCAVDVVLARAQGPYLSEVREPIRLVDLKAARVLGLNRNTLRKKIKELDINVVKPIK